MFDVGWPELLVVAIVLVVVVGPKDLPAMLRTFGRTTGKLRAMAGDFRRQFDEALKEAELDDVKSVIDTARSMNPTNNIKKHLNPLQKAGEEIKSSLSDATKPAQPSPAKGGEPASKSAHAEAPAKSGAAAMPGEGSAAKPAASRSASKSAKPKANSAAAKKSATTRTRTAAKPKSAASKTAAKPKSAAGKSAASKPAASKTAARKPAAKKGVKA